MKTGFYFRPLEILTENFHIWSQSSRRYFELKKLFNSLFGQRFLAVDAYFQSPMIKCLSEINFLGYKALRYRFFNYSCERELNNTEMRSFLAHVHGRARLDQGDRFFAYILLIIEFKGILVKLKK